MNKMREAIRASAIAPALVTDERGEQSFCFDETFIGFAGHFPTYPILPAFLQTLLAQLLAEQVVGQSLQFDLLQRAKFTRQIRPDEKVDVSLSCLQKEGQVRCVTQLKVDDEPAASFTLILTKGPKL
jgi:3-hydroxyacyl-[acyl-carrier-protein] dehydratase